MTTIRLGASRIGYEVKTYFRQGDSVFFTFLFPLVMLTIFSVAFSEQNFGPEDEPLSAAAFYLPGMLAAGLLLSGLQNMAIDIGAIDELGGPDARVPVVRWREHGVLHEERTTTPGALVARLGEPDDLQVIRPSLEDIYLQLVSTSSTAEEVAA